MPDAPVIAVITDSTADIPAEIAEQHGITVIPLSVTFGTETLDDGVLSQPEFFARMAAEPALPTTSQPAPGAFVRAYAEALERAQSVISVHISHKLSGTIESARQAAAEFPGRVHVFDSLNLSWGLAFSVVEAARMAREGLSPEAVLSRLEGVRERVRLLVGLDSLDNLAKGGRIGRVSAFLGSMLNLKVTLTVDLNGEFQPVARNRGERAALEHTMAWVADVMAGAREGSFAVGYAMRKERADELAERLRKSYRVRDLVVYPAGSAICTHTGTGWGVAVLPAE